MAPLRMARREVRQTRGMAGLTALLVAVCLVVLVAGSQAALPSGVFELDKNAAPASAGAQPRADDWNDVFAQINADANDTGDDDKCVALGAVECAFVADPPNATIFTGGSSKDHIDIPGWQHTSGSVPDKDEITNAYAAKYVVNNEQILYFGADRFAQNGSADFGFWFFKSPVSAITSGPGAGTFSGVHSVGDILILGTFTQGGATATARVFRWVGTGGNESGTINGPEAAFGDCVPGNATQNGCSTVNSGLIPVAWTYASKGGDTQVPAGGFVEGGVNLTAIGLGGCFSSFVAETRSSPSITATLKDFVFGNFEVCDSALTTTPRDGAGGAIPANGLSIGTGSVTATDSANLVVSGATTWAGTLKFFLCGPTSLAGAYAPCTTAGTQIGAAAGIAVTQATPMPVLSAAATLTSAGKYCWRAEFASSTQGVPPATDARETECFTVNPVTPTVTTEVSDDGPVPPGTAISDNATIAGTATPSNGVFGTITWRAYGPDDATCGTAVYTSVATMTSGKTTYNSFTDGNGGAFAPTAPGTYRWRAFYAPGAGDANNLAASGACNDANEAFIVQQFQPSLSTAQTFTVKDSATITVAGSTALAGSVRFRLFESTDCTGATLVDQTIAVAGASPQTRETTPLSITTTKTVLSWLVEYTSTEPFHKGVQATCRTENASLTINNGSSSSTPFP